nr:MAG TPA: hypothetical protein [Caudoviricetes sp.]
MRSSIRTVIKNQPEKAISPLPAAWFSPLPGGRLFHFTFHFTFHFCAP